MSILVEKILIFSIAFVLSEAVTRNFDFIFVDVACRVHDRTLVSDMSCQLSQLQHNSRPLSTLNLSLTIGRAAHNWHLRMILHAMRPKSADESVQKLFDADLNICDFLNAKTPLRIFVIATKTLERFANEMPKCPLKQNFTYTFANFHFSPDDYPLYTPEGSFKISLKLHEGDKASVDIDMRVDVIYRRNVWQKIGGQKRT